MVWEAYDVVVVGGGHAGAEASVAAARLGAKTLLITQSIDNICQMSCNPAIGGVAKGQIVREIDALGGMTAVVTDKSTIQFRMLNMSKGPAMWSPRAQCDKLVFARNWRLVLENTPGLSLFQDEVVELRVCKGAVCGVVTRMGVEVPARAVVLTSGTFLNGRIFIGEVTLEGGRIGECPAVGLSDQLRTLGFEVERLKTGTPVRVDGRTIDFSRLVEQRGDEQRGHFSFVDVMSPLEQRSCYIANTNMQTHAVLRSGFNRSPLFTGRIQGRGPRYCPSIEDKIERFADKDHHQLFVEPEGLTTQSYYLNGFSSSLPMRVQLEALHTIVGFEQARIFKPGYAIEYDYFPPTQLNYTLETKLVENLFFAGQINGTTGYEEAACQGLMAGINAALKIQGRPSFVLNRTQAYIGVLIDDLVTKGVDEPYRMFTSRAEYRILLRQGDADQRLTPLAYDLGMVDESRKQRVEAKVAAIQRLCHYVSTVSVTPTDANVLLGERGSSLLQQKVKLLSLLLRPELHLSDLMQLDSSLQTMANDVPATIRDEVLAEVETQLKYQRYIEKEQEVADRILKFEDLPLHVGVDYFSIPALSYEAREKLTRMKPKTIGQASRISGVSPADVSVLLIMMNQGK